MEENKENVTMEELAEAFKPEANAKPQKEEKTKKKEKSKKPKKLKNSIIVFVIGLLVLIAGIIYIVITFTRTPAIADGEYLTEIGTWVLDAETNCVSEKETVGTGETNCIDGDGGSGVIWEFTEVGKGTLTTNNHTNDYDFIWAIEDGKLLIETDWLYTLNNEYEYTLNQAKGELILKADDKEYKFVKSE
ncbi:hypothetical protein IJG89_01050 [Candidatus Saccharibacteria bacterium]|nr:hypothetical protein [Candidatus Saccharibacteria bacterium]